MSSAWNDLSKFLLIREFLMRPYLYERGHNSRIERQRGINEIADVLRSNGANFTATQISAQLRYLKTTYKKHHLKMEQDRLDGKPVSEPSWKFFNHLRFLGELDAPAASQTLATQIYPSPRSDPSHATRKRGARSVLYPTVDRPFGNLAAEPEAATSLPNETKPHVSISAATKSVSSTTLPDIESESPKLAQENKTCLKIETVAQCSNYEYTLENSAYGHDFEQTPRGQKINLPRCTVSLNPESTTEGDDDEANDVAVADDQDDDVDFKHFGAFVTKTLKRLSTSFDQSMAKRARTNIKDMLFRVEFVRMRSDYASVFFWTNFMGAHPAMHSGSGHGSGRSTGVCGGSFCPVIVQGGSSSAPKYYNLNFLAKATVHFLNATHTYQISFKASNPGVFNDHTFGTTQIQPAQVQSTNALNGTAKFYEPFSYRTKVEMVIDGNSVASDYCDYNCKLEGGCDCTTEFSYNESEQQSSAAVRTLNVPLPFVFVHDTLMAVQSLGDTAWNALDSSLNGLD